MKLSKKRAAEIQLAIDDAAEAQTRFWDALRELECLTDREIDGSSDMEGMSVDDFFGAYDMKISGGCFTGTVIVPDYNFQHKRLARLRDESKPCTCAERSWYGEEHDSACERTGKR